MEKTKIILFATTLLLPITMLFSQGNTSIASSLELYVFPGENQSKEQQDADEVACFKWAKEQTGYDPMNPSQVQAAEVDKSADGSAVRGAARGAAAGAAIGAIAGDTGDGAAIGAVVGGIRGRRAKRYGDQVEQQQVNSSAQAQQDKMLDDYKRAFSVCMEAKGYTVK